MANFPFISDYNGVEESRLLHIMLYKLYYFHNFGLPMMCAAETFVSVESILLKTSNFVLVRFAKGIHSHPARLTASFIAHGCISDTVILYLRFEYSIYDSFMY